MPVRAYALVRIAMPVEEGGDRARRIAHGNSVNLHALRLHPLEDRRLGHAGYAPAGEEI